ncbi:MAG: TonB-dependent receptor [Anaeromyxobacter sp.]
MKRALTCLARLVTLVLVTGTASAQTTGTLIGVVTDAATGKPVAGAVVIATSPALQGEQTAVTDGNGNYRITLLPPGEYKLSVQLEGFKPSERADIRLSMDKVLRANLAVVPEAVQMEEQLVRTGTAPVVNVGSAEAGAVISSEFVSSVPIGRNFEQVALVAPTAAADAFGTSFAGAGSPENAYILDGLTVSDPTFGNNNALMLSNFVQEIDVKTGNFSAEYGRATGGVVNVVTKSGSNEFHGSVFGNFSPSWLVQPDGKVGGNDGEAIGFRSTPRKGDMDLDFGFEVGGPVMKDRLWFFAGFAPVVTERNGDRFYRANVLDGAGNMQRDADGFVVNQKIPGTDQYYKASTTTYQFAGKLTLLVDENNQLSASAYGTPTSATTVNSILGESTRRYLDTDTGSTNGLARYAGKFLDKRLIVEGLVGYHRSAVNDRTTGPGRTLPQIQWRQPTQLTAFNVAASDGKVYEPLSAAAVAACTGDPDLCWMTNYTTGGVGPAADYTSDRLKTTFSAAYLLDAFGSHNVKAGVDLERMSYDVTKWYSGGVILRADSATASNDLTMLRGYARVLDDAGNPALTGNTLEWLPVSKSQSVNNSFSYYVQDAWTVKDSGVTLQAGLRLETQTMEATNKGGVRGIDVSNMWSPRVQGIWDFTGTGRGKLGVAYGRFYYAIPLDMGDRAFGNEQQASTGWNCDQALTPTSLTRDPRAQASCAIEQGWADGTNAYANTGGITPVQKGLKGIYDDQFGAQLEYELLADLSVGLDYQGRRQGSMIEDMSDDDGTTYFIANPGQGRPFSATYLPGTANSFTVTKNPKEVTALDTFTRRTVTVQMPAPVRNYDALTFKMTKQFSKNWLAQASYTYSSLVGNVAGVFDPITGQLDPGINAEYDLATLMANKKGRLPGDRPHAFKAFGAYGFQVNPKARLTTSAAFTATSGTPIGANGRHPLYGNGYAYIVQRGAAGRTPFNTQLDLGGRFEYTITPPYAVKVSVDVFNVLNSQDTLALDTNYTFDNVQVVSNIKCDTNAGGAKDPISHLQNACPQLKYLKTVDGRPVTVNPSYGRPFGAAPSFQAPLSLRVGVALTF